MPRDTRSAAKKKLEAASLPLAKTNFVILGIALLVITAGYYALAQKPWDGFMPLVVAPILLVAGYCVLIPLGILYRKKSTETKDSRDSSSGATETKVV